MSRIFITGDTHGNGKDLAKLMPERFLNGNDLTKDDYVIIAGDFGMIWENYVDETEQENMKWFEKRPWTTLVVPGNHENYDRIFKMPISEMFGGKVRKYNDSVILLERGETYTIAGKTFWVMGGGLSIDKIYRTIGVSWWEREQPNRDELWNGINSLANINGKVDYIITHVAPQSALKEILGSFNFQYNKYKDNLSLYLETILNTNIVSYKHWFCGHYHDEIEVEDKKLTVLYNKIEELI